MAKTVFKLYISETDALEFADEDLLSLEWEQQSTNDRSTPTYDLYPVYGEVKLQDRGLVLYDMAINGKFDQYDYPIEIFVNNTKVGSFVITQLPVYSYADKTLSLTFGDRLSIADTSIYDGYDYPETAQTLDTIFKSVLKAFDSTLSDENINTILSESVYSSTQTFAKYLETISIPYPYISSSNSFRTAFKQILTVAQAALITDSEIGYRLVRMDGNKACAEEKSIAILSNRTTAQLVPTVILPNKYNVCEVQAKKVEDNLHADEPFWTKDNVQGGFDSSLEDKTNDSAVKGGDVSYGAYSAWTAVHVIFSRTEAKNVYTNTLTIPKKLNQNVKRLVNVLSLPETNIQATIRHSDVITEYNCSDEGFKWTTTTDKKEGFLQTDPSRFFAMVNPSYYKWGYAYQLSSYLDQYEVKMPISSITNNETITIEAWEGTRGIDEQVVTYPEANVAIEGSYTNSITVTEDEENVYLELRVRIGHEWTAFIVNCIFDTTTTMYMPVRALKKQNNIVDCTFTVQYNADFYELNFEENTVKVTSNKGTKENKATISGGGTLMQYPNANTASDIATNTLVTFENGLNGGELTCSAWDYYSFKENSEGAHEKIINYLTAEESTATVTHKKFFAVGDMVVPCKDRHYTPIMTRPNTDGTSGPVYFQVVKNIITFNGGSYSQQLTLREVR